MMSSKQRLLCALALYWENQPERAKEIYEKVARKRDKYLLQGEVIGDFFFRCVDGNVRLVVFVVAGEGDGLCRGV